MENPNLNFDPIIFAGDYAQLATELSVPTPPMMMGDDLPIAAKNRIAAAVFTAADQGKVTWTPREHAALVARVMRDLRGPRRPRPIAAVAVAHRPSFSGGDKPADQPAAADAGGSTSPPHPELSPPQQQLAFLRALFRSGDLIDLRAIDPEGRAAPATRFAQGAEAAASVIAELEKGFPGHNVYVGVASRLDDSSGAKHNLRWVRAV